MIAEGSPVERVVRALACGWSGQASAKHPQAHRMHTGDRRVVRSAVQPFAVAQARRLTELAQGLVFQGLLRRQLSFPSDGSAAVRPRATAPAESDAMMPDGMPGPGVVDQAQVHQVVAEPAAYFPAGLVCAGDHQHVPALLVRADVRWAGLVREPPAGRRRIHRPAATP